MTKGIIISSVIMKYYMINIPCEKNITIIVYKILLKYQVDI